jgi:hypothetical protein
LQVVPASASSSARMGNVRGRRVAAVLVVIAVAGLMAVGWWYGDRWKGLERASYVAAVLALLVALPTPLGLQPLLPRPYSRDEDEQVNRAAESLARTVRDEVEREESLWKVGEPIPLPVRWVTVPPGLADHWANIRRSRDTNAPLYLDGFLDQIGKVFTRVPSRRLVILGPAGAGKTVLALRFCLDQFTHAETDPVTSGRIRVIFRLTTWNPNTQTLADWMASQLEANDPGLHTRTSTGKSLAAELVRRRRLLPIFDGLDEIPQLLRKRALSALNSEFPVSEPLLLTSRNENNEYADAVGQVGVLAGAGVVALQPLSLDALTDYLTRSTSRPDQADKWRSIY